MTCWLFHLLAEKKQSVAKLELCEGFPGVLFFSFQEFAMYMKYMSKLGFDAAFHATPSPERGEVRPT